MNTVMLHTALMGLWLVAAEPAPPTTLPTAAVLDLEAETGVDPKHVKLLTQSLVDEVRSANAFSSVISSREIQALLGFEQQKQLMACTETSCMAELSGALGVDYLVIGGVGKIGESYLFSLRLIDARKAKVLASLSRRLKAASVEAVLDAMKPSVQQLLHEGGLISAPEPAPVTEPVAAPEPAAPSDPVVASAPQPPAATPPAEDAGGGMRGPLLGVGGASLALAALGGLGAVLMAATAIAVMTVPFYVVAVPTPLVPREVRNTYFFPAVASAAGVAGVLGVLITLGLVAAGGGALVGGVVAG